MSTGTVVELRRVSKEYEGPPRVKALDSVSIRVYEGDYVAISGPSGSGKSTLLNVIGLLTKPTAGVVLVDGEAVETRTDSRRSDIRNRDIGFVFQSFRLLAYRSVLENVLLGDAYSPVLSRRERITKAMTWLERLGLAGRAEGRPENLSGGQQQRVAIARAVIGSPRVLICDEPTGNLDAATAADVMDAIEEIRDASNIAIVVATHNASVGSRATRMVEMDSGRVVDQDE